jgi:hypothetical protein
MADYKKLITTVGRLARGERYSSLFYLCSTQRTVSTRKLLAIVEKLYDEDKILAVDLSKIANDLYFNLETALISEFDEWLKNRRAK